ncbi:hypothetical protein RND61_05745 [Streptomyces sp. TRM76323]|uniref:Uncharacterized protein n=1 Tax=Streptomyces tamarix TaxID=3078565 RepID=A0ABU3QFN5_9ACTN|nr:hypothetical protein [Streptomyces tamarix]MDT9681580.1 hypothetical protein [Streptomyces tamarix]
MIPEPPTRTEDEAADAARKLRAVFAEAAHDITPAPVPLAAIERAGRARRRRRTTALTTGCALTVTAMTLALLHTLAPSGPPSVASPPALEKGANRPVGPSPSPSPSTSPSAKPPRVVAPGERVDAGGGWKVWLTRNGKYWAGPDGYENFRSVTDGNINLSQPGISHQSTGDDKGVFHSGLYYGTKNAARLELTDTAGRRTTATLLELPGEPGWGVWYATTPPDPSGDGGSGEKLALYDASSRLITTFP